MSSRRLRATTRKLSHQRHLVIEQCLTVEVALVVEDESGVRVDSCSGLNVKLNRTCNSPAFVSSKITPG